MLLFAAGSALPRRAVPVPLSLVLSIVLVYTLEIYGSFGLKYQNVKI